MSSPPIGPGWARRLTLAGCTLLAVIGLLLAPATGTDSPDTYEDAATSVHAPAIGALETAGIVDGTGCGSDRFCPTEPLPRWAMAVWLVRALDGREPTTTTAPGSFADVDSSVWWAAHVERLAQLGITTGCSTLPHLHPAPTGTPHPADDQSPPSVGPWFPQTPHTTAAGPGLGPCGQRSHSSAHNRAPSLRRTKPSPKRGGRRPAAAEHKPRKYRTNPARPTSAGPARVHLSGERALSCGLFPHGGQ